MAWFNYAILSALFAALTAILSKIGVKDVNSNLATAIRTIVILLFAWGIVFYQGTAKQIPALSKVSVLFLILSAITTGLSWLFYFRALQLGDVAKVSSVDKLSLAMTVIFAFLILGEKLTLVKMAGVLLMVGGAVLIGLGI